MIYELTIIFKPEIKDEVAERRLRNIVEAMGGEIIKRDWDGVKLMPYQMRGYTEGDYFFAEVGLNDPKEVEALSDYLSDHENVLRFLLVKQELRSKK